MTMRASLFGGLCIGMGVGWLVVTFTAPAQHYLVGIPLVVFGCVLFWLLTAPKGEHR